MSAMGRARAKVREQERHEREIRKGWTPVLRGDAYCSPLCGGGPIVCSIKNYERAVDVSNKVAKDLGPGWTPVAWENLGWHAKVISPCRRIKISVPTGTRAGDTYTAFLGPVEPYNTLSGKWAEFGRTAREAIENVLNAAKRDLGIISGAIEGLEVPALPKRKHSGGWIKNCGYCGSLGTAPGKCPKCGRKKR